MAVNPRPDLPNRHTGYIACSGYGKSQALKQNKDIPTTGARVLLWDTDDDHARRKNAKYYSDRRQFLRAVMAGMKSGRGFCIGWNGWVDHATFEWWCSIAWACLDGRKPLYLIIEELADVQPSVGKAAPMFGQLCRKARKYNGIIHWTSQRSEEISKTVYSQTGIFWIGCPNDTCTTQQANNLSRIAGCQGGAADLYALEPLQFFRREKGKTEKICLKYKNL